MMQVDPGSAFAEETLPEGHARAVLGSECAPRLGSIIGSPLRALLSSAEKPAVFDLAGGIPDPNLFPGEAFALAAQRVLGSHADQALQYAPTEGLIGMREWFAARLRLRGVAIGSEQILITHGSQHALATVALLLGDKGRPVAIEQPAFLGAEQAFGVTESRLVPLPITDEGWDWEAIRGSGVAAAYVNPDYQNPTGRTVSKASRSEMAHRAEQEGFFIVEDDAYAELGFSGAIERPIFADTDRGILIGTLSKTLCPGIRVGYIAAPKPLIEPLTRILQASTLQPGTLAQALAFEVVQTIDFDAHRRKLVSTYRDRARSLETACERAGVQIRPASGGFYLWANMERSASSDASWLRAQGLSAVPERAFRLRGSSAPDRHLRLSFSRLDPRTAGHISGLLATLSADDSRPQGR